MEKRLYTDRRTLYINDRPASEYRFGNLRYGEPEREGKVSMKKRKNEIRLTWHPYPEEKPKQARNCIVSISCDGTEYTTSSWWDSEEKQFEDYWDRVIIAWAYMPRPYKKESS